MSRGLKSLVDFKAFSAKIGYDSIQKRSEALETFLDGICLM
jgi:hypothetical protein